MSGKFKYQLLLAGGDAVALVLSGLIGLYLRFEGLPPQNFLAVWFRYMIVAVPLYLVVYYYFGLYRRMWRYASVDDLLVIAGAVSLATACLFTLRVVNPASGFPRSVIIMTWLINIAAVGGMRFVVRLGTGLLSRQNGHRTKRALIIGAGDAGRILVSELDKHRELDYFPIGFLDDDACKVGLSICGLPVLGTTALLEEMVKSQSIDQVIIAMPSASLSKTRDLTQRSIALGIKPLIVPGLYSILNEDVKVSSLREVQLEDLLQRPEIKLDSASISGYLASKTVLITGAGGSIGGELARQVAGFSPARLLLLGRGENSIYDIHRELAAKHPALSITALIADVQDAERIDYIFDTHRPAVVFHAAAHKHVPLMEANPTEAIKTNVLGTQTLARAALRSLTERFVLVSTDKAVNPTSVMGATKRMAEHIVQSYNGSCQTKFMVVRFGNVLGSRGSVIPLFKEQIAKGGPVTVTHPEMTRYFMTIPEAVSLIIQAGAMGQGGEVFVLDMGKSVKILDLARELVSLSGLKPDIDIAITFTGMRPGEKLYEELFAPEEGTLATMHKQILIAKQPPTAPAALAVMLRAAQALTAEHCSPDAVLALLHEQEQVYSQEIAATVPAAGVAYAK
ncbi:MAG: UDP-N-acetyl-alpha-D-glucosamine C6 dehydratase [Firmicutes bacterium]|nr:UDP-N-acetyl-alpha-D-glucosamine C6 dehydratase [Bacillota bacterium]